MSKSTKDFVAIVDLKEGEHEYKFLVDGEWVNDPNEPKVIDATDENGCTVKNNLIRVQKEDFDAYHALDMDSKAVALAQQNHKKRLFSDTFSQEIPQYVTERTEHRTGPPILPPHLLQVILNKVIYFNSFTWSTFCVKITNILSFKTLISGQVGGCCSLPLSSRFLEWSNKKCKSKAVLNR